MEHPLLQSYGPLEGWHILLIMGLTAIGFFLYQVRKAISLVMLGSQDNRFDSWDARILEFIIGWLGQKKVLRDRIAGTMHVFLFWGFLMLSSDMLDLATANFFSDRILPDLLNGPWNGMVELGYAMAMIGCVAALIRRMVFTPQKLKGKSNFETFEGNLILVLIFTITTTSFVIESKEDPSKLWEPLGYAVAQYGVSDSFAVASYWAHMLSICVFLFLIPLSKHMHLVMAVPNVFFHDVGPTAKMRPLAVDDFGRAVPMDDILEKDSIGFGVSNYTDYTWRQLIDGWSCTSCARCQDVCPLYIEHVPKLTDLRRNAVMETMEYPDQLNVAFDNMDAAQNPYGFGAHERADWASDLDVKVGEPAEYIYFVGCAASFDERNQKVARATISLLKEAGLDVGILGMQEGCSGDPARRAGNEFLFQMLAEANMMTFQELGVKRIIASCPHCFHTLGKEYADYGGDRLEVYHHSEILAKLQDEGKLPQAKKDGRSITFHDPCYLGRIGGIIDEPREVIGGVDVETEKHAENSFCCGAGGAQMWMEEDADKRVNEIRAKELAETGCDTVAVGCPFCSVMVKDGLDSVGAEMEVMDVAEIMWEQIVARDKEIHELMQKPLKSLPGSENNN